MKVYVDGKEWMETDYLTVNKDLHVKGDFTLDGGGSQTFDTIITGSFKVSGVSGLGTAPKTPRAVVIQALGTAPLRKGLQIRAPAAYQSRYLEILAGSNESNVRFYVGTSQTVNYGTFISGRGSFRSMAPVISPLIGSFGSFTRLSVKGSAHAGRFYGSVGSFTRVIPGVAAGSVGSFTRSTVKGSAYARTSYGSLGSFSRVTSPFGSFRILAVQGTARFYGPTNLPTVVLTGASSQLSGSFSGDSYGTAFDPQGLALDGSFVYLTDHRNPGDSRLWKRYWGDWSFVGSYLLPVMKPLDVGLVRLDPAGARGSYVYVVGTGTALPYGKVSKIKISDLSVTKELNGTWPYGAGGYGTFDYELSGVAARAGSVYILCGLQPARVVKMNLGLTAGTVLINPGATWWNPGKIATDGTYIMIIAASPSKKLYKYNMAGAALSNIALGGSNENPIGVTMKGQYCWVSLYNTIAGDYSVEKRLVSNLSKLSEFNPTSLVWALANMGSFIYHTTVSAPKGIWKWTIGGDSTLIGAAVTMTFGSFAEISAGASRLYGTIKGSKYLGTSKISALGGSATPGSAGYIIFPRAFIGAPHRGVSLTMKDGWDPSTIRYGPRIKRVAAGSMQAMGSPAGYAWWQAVGSAF